MSLGNTEADGNHERRNRGCSFLQVHASKDTVPFPESVFKMGVSLHLNPLSAIKF